MSSRLRSLNSTKISFFAFQDIITSVSGILILVTLILATELDRPSSRATQDADPELERQLSETLRHQVEVDAQNQNLQTLLLAAETAPATEKLESDITRLRAQLAEEKKRHSSLAEQLAASQAAIEARDRTLGLTDLKAQIQRVLQEVESLAHQEAAVRKEMASLGERVTSVQSKLLKLREREGKLWLIPDNTSTIKEPILAVISAAGAKLERFDHPADAKEFGKSSARTDFGSYLAQAKPLDQYVVFLVRPSGIALFGSLVKMAREKGFEVGFDALEEEKDVYFSTPPIPDETTPPPRRTASQYQPGSGGYSDPRGGAGEVGASASGPGQKHPKAPDADGSQHAPGDGSSASAEPHKQPPTTAAPPAPSSAAHNRTLWQRFLEWLGFSGSKGGTVLVGSTNSSTKGVGSAQSSGTAGDGGGRGTPSTAAATTRGGSGTNAHSGSPQPSESSPTQAGIGEYGGTTPAGQPGTATASHGKAAKGQGAGSGAGNGTDSGFGAGAGSGAGKATTSDAGGGAGSGARNGNSAGAGHRNGAGSVAAGTNGTATLASKSQDAAPRNADTSSSAFTDPNKNPSPPTPKPTPPPPPKPKSWWQRFLEWIGLR